MVSNADKAFLAITLAVSITEKEKRKKRWCKEWYKMRYRFTHEHLQRTLQATEPDDYKKILRMDNDSFETLLELIRPNIEKQDTNMRQAIPASQRLSITLRYLVTVFGVMECLPPTPILGFNPDTLRDVRGQFHLDDVTKIHDASQIFWANNKRAKIIIPWHVSIRVDCILPKMTSEHERVYLLRNDAKKFEHGLLHYYKYLIALAEYEMANDYNNGVIAIFDYMDADMFVLMKLINIVELHLSLMIMTEGFGMRVKGLHILSKNKGIDVIVKIFKRVLSKKLANRLQVHKSFDTLYDYVPRDVLPVEYGGAEKSLRTLYENNLNEITSEKFQKHLVEMSEAVTNEKLRRKSKVGVSNTDNDIPCTFGTLTID